MHSSALPVFSTQTTLHGVDVFTEGHGPHTVLMIHGWPDTHRLWDSTVDALKSQFRCVRFTLPGFDATKPPGAKTLADMTAFIVAVADAVSPSAPVTLLLHDWGCMFGYEFAAKHPQRVARVVGVDIGDYNSGAYLKSLSVSSKLMALAYQVWLAIAWKVGQRLSAPLANRMTRWMARALGCRSEPAHISWQMNYPYAMAWFGESGGLTGTTKVKPIWPMLYIYAERKPFMFHSPQWLAQVAQTAGNQVQGFATGHWVMGHKPAEFNACVKAWLNAQCQGS